MTQMPTPSPDLIEALNKCRKREGVCGIAFEPLSSEVEAVMRRELKEMGLRPTGRFYNLSPTIVDHFKQSGLDASNSVNLREARAR